jgi:hypothetical protein
VNIDVASDVGNLGYIKPIESITLLPRRQHILKLPNLIELTQIH